MAASCAAPATGGTSTGVAAISLTNGPPNLPNALMGAGIGPNNHVSLLYAEMSPMSVAFTGTFTLSGPDASSFQIVHGNELQTNVTLAARDYDIVIGTSGGGVSQAVTVHAVSGTLVPCGGAIPTSGTVILAPNCTYNVTSAIMPSSNTTYIGVGNGSTVLDGGGGYHWLFGATESGGRNVTVAGIAGQNAAGLIDGFGGAVVRNSRMTGSLYAAIHLYMGGGEVINNVIDHSYENNIQVYTNPGPGTMVVTIVGNDMGFGNQGKNDTCNNGGNIKWLDPSLTDAPTTMTFKNNYVHDNQGTGFWADTVWNNSTIDIQGNTFARDGNGGIEIEDTFGSIDISNNVFTDEGSGATYSAFTCSGTVLPTWPWPAIWMHAARDSITIHDNNLASHARGEAGTGTRAGDLISLQGDTRVQGACGPQGHCDIDNVVIRNNTATFADPSVKWQSQWAAGYPHAGTSSDNNHFWVSGGSTSDPHFGWWDNFGPLSAAGMCSIDGQDCGSTVQSGDEQAIDHVMGCTRVACTSSGVGANGAPK
jgi:hypothetical protein